MKTKSTYGILQSNEDSVQPQTINHASLVDSNRITEKEEEEENEENLSLFSIAAILSTAFSYGCILTTLFLITLPVECERVNLQHPNIPKSVALGIFVTIAGVTQLISPLVGKLSDSYLSPVPGQLGQRLPYLVLGSVATVAGLLGQMVASAYGFWIRYSLAFFGHMIGCKSQKKNKKQYLQSCFSSNDSSL
jgi:MFS family permease